MPLEKDLTQMSDDEFKEWIDNYTPPSSHQTPDHSTSTFFEQLYESSKKQVKQIVPLTISIKDGQIEFNLPSNMETTIQIRNNEIFVGDRRLVVTLANQN